MRSRALVSLFVVLLGTSAFSQLRKIGELELQIQGTTATVQPANPTIPKNTPAGVQIVVSTASGTLNSADAARFLGGPIQVTGELSGPGLSGAMPLPAAGAPAVDPLILPIPPLEQPGDYTLSNLKILANGTPALDVTPSTITVKVIDQVLITSVETRPLTLDEIKAAGVVLTSNDFIGFQFTVGLALQSNATTISFPVVFDRQGVPVPTPLLPPPPPSRESVPIPTIVPVLLNLIGADGKVLSAADIKMPDGSPAPVKIPGVLVIPGNVGFLKQFFSAKLLVANGAPGGTGLVVHDVNATINLPPGPDGVLGNSDDPLSLPTLQSGPEPATKPVKGVGPDGISGTADDVNALNPGDQGETEFIVRGDHEGYSPISFDIKGTLNGLVTGPVTITGQAQGGVLVRNPFFDMTFAVPAVVRNGEQFKVFITVKNISQTTANLVTVTLDKSQMSGLQLVSDQSQTIPTLAGGGSKILTYVFQSQRTGQVSATYLHFDTTDGTTGELKFTLGVGERNIPLSPDTLVLPASVDSLPEPVVDAAMRVLGEAWSIANAPAGTLPANVIPTSKAVATQKALALAEAGLRVELGESLDAALRDLLADFYGGKTLDAGFDQLLRTTDAGQDFERAVGAALQQPAASVGVLNFQKSLSNVFASGGDFISFALASGSAAPPVVFSLTDGSGNVSQSLGSAQFSNNVPGFTEAPLGPSDASPVLALLTAPGSFPYTLLLSGTGSGTVDVAVTMPHADGNVIRGEISGVQVSQGLQSRIVMDFSQPDRLVLEQDTAGDGSFATQLPLTTSIIAPLGPQLLGASVIDSATIQGASALGVHMALLFDRAVQSTTAQQVSHYQIPANAVQQANAQLSGRIVIANLQQPEGPYVPTSVAVNGIADLRGVIGPGGSQTLASRLQNPGAVVSGRILNADGSPVGGAVVTYTAYDPDDHCDPDSLPSGIANVPVDGQGRYQFRYVVQDPCARPFSISTQDPTTGDLRTASNFVRFAGEQMLMDIALFGRGSVAGTVKDLTGAPIPGANVVVLSVTDPQVGGQAVADGNGQYLVSGITVGPVTVQAGQGTKLGHSAGTILRAGTTAAIDVTLDSGGTTVSGVLQEQVNGAQPAPVPNWPVVYYLNDRFPPTPVAVVNTDGSGKFVFTAVPEGSFTITAQLTARDSGSATGFAIAGQPLTGEIITVNIDDRHFATVQGKVVFPDAAHTPAGGVIVFGPGGGVLTNPDGTFTLPGLPISPNSQTLSARTTDGLRFGTASVVASQPGQLITNIIITLSGLGTAQFTVFDGDGKPLAGQAVNLVNGCASACGCNQLKTVTQPDGSVQVISVPAVTGPDGVVKFTDMPVGAVAVRAISSSFDVADGSATITGDGAVGLGTLRFHGIGTVTGTVLDPDGKPSFGANVSLTANTFDQDSCSLIQGLAQQTSTDTSGAFNFSSVKAGHIGITATQTFFNRTVGAQGNLASHQTVNFVLKLINTTAGVFSGTVFLPDGTTPAGAGVQVTANGALPNVTVSTDANGQFKFAKIFPEGSYTVTVSDPVTGGTVQDTVFLRAGQDMPHNYRLKGRGTVVVQVVDGSNNPVDSASVTLNENTYPFSVQESAVQPANQGQVTFSQVFEGPFAVTASDSVGRGGRTSGVLPNPGATANVTVHLTSTGTVQGHFKLPDQNGTPIPFGSVSLFASGRQIGQVTTDGSADPGSFSFTFVPAGPVTLQAQDPVTARTGIAAGTIDHDGQVLTLDVIAQALGTVQGLVTSNGVAQPGANVDIFSGSYHASTTSDSQGLYKVIGVPAGHIVVNASMQNGFLLGTNSATLDGEGTVLELDVALRGSGAIAGQVVQANGAPAPGAVVTVTVGGSGGGTETVSTDVSGNFAFSIVPEGVAQLNVSLLDSIDVGQGVVNVVGGSTVQATVHLNGVGSITGHTRDSSGAAIAGHLIINGTGPFPYTFVIDTNSDGVFSLPQVLAGPFTASLTVISNGLTLSGTAFASVQPNANTDIDVPLQFTGSITGTVFRADGTTPAAGAQVTVQLDAGGTIVVQAPTSGLFTINGIPLGKFSVAINDPVSTGLAFFNGLNLSSNGQNIDLGKVTLTLDTTPPVVQLVSPADGAFIASATPTITVTATDDLSGVNVSNVSMVIDGQQVASGSLSVRSQVAFPDGIHSLAVSVPDNVGNVAVTHSHFAIDTQPPTAPQITGLTDGQTVNGFVRITATSTDAGSGVAKFNFFLDSGTEILGAPVQPPFNFAFTSAQFVDGDHTFNAQAIDGVGNVSQTTTLHIVIKNNVNTATVIGRVFRLDGTTAASGIVVRLSQFGFPRTTTVSAADGGFRFDAVGLGSYTLEALDEFNTNLIRAQAPLQLFTAGTVVTQNLTFVALGTVTGHVFNSDGSPAQFVNVSVKSNNPQLSLLLASSTDGTGLYTINGVPIGSFLVLAQNPSSLFAAEATGNVKSEGDTETIDLTLLNNAIPLPTSLSDANGDTFGIQKGGDVQEFSTGIFQGNNADLTGGFNLDLVANGTAFRFTGADIGRTSQQGKEIAIQQTGLAGLDVTRKVFVPSDGYFARYIEILSNPTAAPVTVDVRVTSNTTNFSPLTIFGTSSGDQVLDVSDPANPDRWVALSVSGLPLAFVFDGPGSAQRVGEATAAQNGSANQVAYAWQNITVPPNGKVAFMHFGVVQKSNNSAQASAQRLVQLPPESLAGLTPDEITAIQNFAVPADGLSTLPPLPPLTGVVSGRTLASDGRPIGFASVNIQSDNLIFQRFVFGQTDQFGNFNFFGLPLDSFTINASQFKAGAVSVHDNFPAGQTSVNESLVFPTGDIQGTVRRANGSTNTCVSQVEVILGSSVSDFPSVAQDGTYASFGLTPGTYTVLTVNSCLGLPQGRTTAQVVAGQTTTADIVLPALANAVQVTVLHADGTPYAGAQIFMNGFFRTTADQNGLALISNVSQGGYLLMARDPSTFATIVNGSAVVTPADDGQVVSVTLQQVTQASQVNGTIFAGDGATPVRFAQVQLIDTASGQALSFGSSDSTGAYSFPNIFTQNPAFTVVARAFNQVAQQNGTFTGPGDTETVNVSLPVAVIQGKITFFDGSPVPFPNVFATQNTATGTQTFFSSFNDANGNYQILGLVGGDFTITDNENTLNAKANGTITSVTNPVVVNLVLPPSGTVKGNVFDANGAPASVGVILTSNSLNSSLSTFTTNGQYEFDHVPLGSFDVGPGATGVLASDGETVTVDINTPAPGTLTGTVSLSDGTAAAFVRVQANQISFVQTDAGGHYQLTLPAGPAAITATDNNGNLGFGSVVITPSGSNVLNLTLAPGAEFDNQFFTLFNLDGTDGFRYDLDCAGDVANGGLIGKFPPAFGSAYSLKINGVQFPCITGASQDLGGRELVMTAVDSSGLNVTRKVFVPTAGKFARYLEILSNQTDTPISVSVEVDAFEGAPPCNDGCSPLPLRLLTDPAANGNLFAVTTQQNGCCTIADVLQDGKGRISVAGTHYVDGDVNVGYHWDNLIIPPGLTVSLMHFGLQRNASDQSGAQSQAQSLVNLTDPDALAGLTPADLAAILNFNAAPGGSVAGTANVEVTVLGSGGSGMAGAQVVLQNSAGSVYATPTAADGTTTIFNVAVGSFTVSAYKNGFAGSANGSVRSADVGGTVGITINAPFSGTVQGTVVAGDGQTAVSGAEVDLFDIASGELIATTSTDVSGAYQFSDVAAGGQGFKVRAFSHVAPSSVAEQTTSLTTNGGTAVVNLVLPLAVLRGTVFFFDGVTPVPNPNLFLTKLDAAGNLQAFFVNSTDANGNYTFIGAPSGNVSITAQDGASGLQTIAAVSIPDSITPPAVNIQLPAAGTVNGAITDSTGTAVSAQVNIADPGNSFVNTTFTDSQGGYQFTNIAVGPFLLQTTVCCSGSASRLGSLTQNNQTVTVNISLPGTGTVTGTVSRSDGTPAAFAFVTVQSGLFQFSGQADNTGHYQITGVQAGDLEVSTSFPQAVAQGSLTAGQTITVNLTAGTGTQFFNFLISTGGFAYTVSPDGTLEGGSSDEGFTFQSPFSRADALTIATDPAALPQFAMAGSEIGGRQLVLGPADVDALKVVRKIFVPSNAGFVRYLEIISNTSSSPVTFDLGQQTGTFRGRVSVNASSGNDTSFIVEPSSANSRLPNFAEVMAGPSATLPVSSLQVQPGSDQILYQWQNVTVPAGSTIIFMHFVMQASPSDTTGLQSQVQALENLTDPNALVGMSAQEKAEVVNFSGPALTGSLLPGPMLWPARPASRSDWRKTPAWAGSDRGLSILFSARRFPAAGLSADFMFRSVLDGSFRSPVLAADWVRSGQSTGRRLRCGMSDYASACSLGVVEVSR